MNETDQALLLACGELSSKKLKMICKVSRKKQTIGVTTHHPGVTRGLIFYSTEELIKTYQAIGEFLVAEHLSKN